MTVNFGWDYPPGVSSIPGDFDKTVSFSIAFPVTLGYSVDDYPNVTIDDLIKETLHWFDNKVKIDPDVKPDINSETEEYVIWVIYEDDIDMEVHGWTEQSEIEEVILDYVSDELSGYLDDRLKPDEVDIGYDVHY